MRSSDEFEAVEDYEEAEDDTLGYYPDGTPRTLTAEQISMFRHSEIQGILKERRRMHEMSSQSPEAEEYEQPRSVEVKAESFMVPPKEASPAPEPYRGQNAKQPNNRKRKRVRNDSGRHSDEEFTPRRIAREQDEQKAVSVELDY